MSGIYWIITIFVGMKNYLVIAELENNGYVIGITDDLKAAKYKIDKLFAIANQYPINQIQRFNKYLKKYQSYTITGNAIYCGKDVQCISNGLFSIYIIEMNKNFTLQQFIYERQYTSYACISEDEIVPEILSYAN